MRKRDKGLYVRCGEDELAAWKQAASKEGLGHSEWIRRTLTAAAMSGDVLTLNREDFIDGKSSGVTLEREPPSKSCRLERFHRKDAYCVACESTQ